MTIPTAHRNELVWLRQESARQALADAQVLVERDSLRGAANRTCYAMFYAVSALALARGATFKTHSGLIGFFQREFVKTEAFSRGHGRALQKAYDDRSEADYDDLLELTKEQVETRIQEAGRLIDAVAVILDAAPPAHVPGTPGGQSRGRRNVTREE